MFAELANYELIAPGNTSPYVSVQLGVVLASALIFHPILQTSDTSKSRTYLEYLSNNF